MVQFPPQTALRERLDLSRFAIAHPWLTLGFWVAVAVAGIFAFGSLKYALFPDITFPVVIVNATAPIETALETETELTQPIEQQLQSLDGLNKIRSTSYAGRTLVNLAFAVGTDLEQSSQKVETALDQLALPPQAAVRVIPLNLNESAVISYTVQSEGKSLQEVDQITRSQIFPVIAKLPGVLKVELLGEAGLSTESTQNASLTGSDPSGVSELPGNALPSGQDSPTLVRFSGQNAIGFQVVKHGSANTLELVKRVREAVKQLQSDLHKQDVWLVLAVTQADYIREAIQATIGALVQAVILAVSVIFLFLRSWRATLITALVIPLALLGTFIVMAQAGFNLETITLLALALVIGIAVDDTIVEVENMSRYLEAGTPPRQAALTASREIGLIVTASTLTIVAVFLPVGLMGGTLGQFFKPFGLTVSAAVLISLLAARTLSPVLAVYWLKPRSVTTSTAVPRTGVAQLYRHVLGWALRHRILVVGLAIVIFVTGIALIPLIPAGFIPKLDRGEFNIVYTAPLPNDPSTPALMTALKERDAAAQLEAERRLAAKYGISLEQLRAAKAERARQTPASPTQDNTDQAIDPQVGFGIALAQSEQVAQAIESAVLASPEIGSVYTIVGTRGRPNQGRLHVKLKGGDRTTSLLRGDGILSTAKVQDYFRRTLPSLPGTTISIEDTPFIETASEQPLQLALLGEDLETLRQTAQSVVQQVKQVPGIVDVTTQGVGDQGDQLNEIVHYRSRRAVYISANLSAGQALGDVTEQVVAAATAILPPEISLDLEGDSGRSRKILRSFAQTLVLSVACMLFTLILPFGRLLEPLVVGLSLPLAVIGAMLSLLLTRSDFSMTSLIGLIFLLGLLDKNALLLMDYTNQLRQAGHSRTEAILQTGVVRLRPILMTMASTVLGMLPIAFGFGAGAELRQPMAVTIIGGLFTSTLLSLIVVPVLYALLEDGQNWLFKRRYL